MYFELGCELGPSEAQAQNTSKNDVIENGTIFVIDFFVEFTCLNLNKAWMCLVFMDNFLDSRLKLEYCAGGDQGGDPGTLAHWRQENVPFKSGSAVPTPLETLDTGQ